MYLCCGDGAGGGYPEYHERLVVCHVRGAEDMVATPTRGLFIEELHVNTNADLFDMRQGRL